MVTTKPLIFSADDEPNIRQLIKRVLESARYGVITAADGNQVLDLIAKKNPELVFLDIQIPGKSGLEVLQELRENHPDTVVIMARVIDDVSIAINAIRKSAYDYLNKPFNVDELVISTERAPERRRLILENGEYQLKLEEKVAEQTQLLKQKMREPTALNNLFVTYLNQGFESPETQNRLASDIIRIAEQIQAVVREAEARKVKVQTPSAEENEASQSAGNEPTGPDKT